MKQRILCLLLLIISAANLSAQDQRIYSQFFMNPYVINPAYVGSTGYTSIFVVHRQQWIGLEDAPFTSHASFHTPISKTLSFGGMVYNDNMGPVNDSGLKATGGYLAKINRLSHIRFGISLGVGYSGVNLDYTNQTSDVINDPALQQLGGTSYVIADAGAVYYYNGATIGLSLPNLVGHDIVSPDGFNTNLKPHENLTFNVGYRYEINKSMAIEPHAIYRFSTVYMPQYEAAVMAHLGHVVWAGLSYRQDYGASVLFGVKVKETWALGLAYEYGETDLDGISTGSVELSFGMNIGKKKKEQKKNSISFIQNFRKTKVELDRAAERRRQLAEQRRQRNGGSQVAANNNGGQQSKQPIADPEETPDKEPDTELDTDLITEAKPESVPKKELLETMEPSEEQGIIGEKIDTSIPLKDRMNDGRMEIGATYVQMKTDSSLITKVKWLDALTETPETNAPLPDNTVRMKKGRHTLLELPAGHHVIAGEFETLDEAEAYSDKIFNMGYHGANPAHAEGIPGDKKWVVVVHKGATMDIAEEEQAKWSKRNQLEHVYILNVLE